VEASAHECRSLGLGLAPTELFTASK
jgi:hypothetical protein